MPGVAVARRRLATKVLPSSKFLLATHHRLMLLRLRWTTGSAALAVAVPKTPTFKLYNSVVAATTGVRVHKGHFTLDIAWR
eukprot:3463698-Pleurochrysis_carterae.AAC.1